jgi:hypothetical protein
MKFGMYIVTYVSDCRRGFGLVNRFINNLQVVSTNNYYTIADFNTTNHSTLRLLNLHSLVFTVLHNGYSSAVSSLDILW